MNLIFTPLTIPLMLATAVALALILYAWPRREAAGAKPFLAMMISVVIWLIGSSFEISIVTLPGKLFWANFSYFGIATLPVAWLLFSLDYTGKMNWMTRRNVILLLFEPTFITIIIWTNNFHHLFRRSVELIFTESTPMLNSELGPFFWVHTAYSYILLVTGTIILVIAFVRASRLYKRQMIIILVGAFIPWVANIFFIFLAKPESTPVLDPTPFSFLATGVMMSWAIFGYNLINIAPIARNRVIENMNEAMIVVDNKGVVVDINPAARRLIGSVDGWIVGQNVTDLFKAWQPLVEKYQDQTRVHNELMFHDGVTERYYDLRISPIYDNRQQINGRLIILHETTAQKRINDELRIAKEKAEDANKAKSAFLATMSHELRTPLTVIIGYAELLYEQAAAQENGKFPERLQKITDSANHLLSIISALLDLSKIEAGKMELYNTDFDVTELIDSVVESVYPLIMKNNNEFTVTIDPTINHMFADEVKMRQILLNLLSNAAKFTQEGIIQLKVFSTLTEKASEKTEFAEAVCFQVVDTGIGLSEEQLDKLFEPFVQANNSTTHHFGGTGLGLSICQHLCHMMGGQIHVDSKLDQGSVFTVTFPRQRIDSRGSAALVPERVIF